MRRIDPPYCGCTDCIVGDSVPLDLAANEDVVYALQQPSLNASGYDFTIATVVTADTFTWTLRPRYTSPNRDT